MKPEMKSRKALAEARKRLRRAWWLLIAFTLLFALGVNAFIGGRSEMVPNRGGRRDQTSFALVLGGAGLFIALREAMLAARSIRDLEKRDSSSPPES